MRTLAARCDVGVGIVGFMFDTLGSRVALGQATIGGVWNVW